MSRSYDFAVIGAGVFGAWTAHYLRRAGASVILLDAYGPANSRASSGGETRVIRIGYGPDELYTKWAIRSLPQWQEFANRCGVQLFHKTGVLWLATEGDTYTEAMWAVLEHNRVCCEKLSGDDVRRRYPQLKFPDVTWAVLEPESGLLMARRAVQALVQDALRHGVEYLHAAVHAPAGHQRVAEVKAGPEAIRAGQFIFACGPWLQKLFPDLLGGRIFPSRQEVFFLGPPPGSDDFQPPKMPVWLHHHHQDIPYSLPDMESRGFKIAFDRHGPEIDPDSDARVVGAESVARLRAFLKAHIPSLADAPVVETRVCQYENTWNGDFLIDRHPECENVWLVGGGSGHGFKHGPALGEYVSNLVLEGAPAEPRFSLASKQMQQRRAVY
jgi:monomeric sarcosine oxidase